MPAAHKEAQETIVELWHQFRKSIYVHAAYNASQGMGDRERGSLVPIRDLSVGGRYHLRNASKLLQVIPAILEDCCHKGIACREVARLIGERLPEPPAPRD